MKVVGLSLASVLFAAQAYSVSLAPAPVQNFCPIVLVNNSTLSADNVWFFAHGNDPDGIPCFLVPNPTTGQCSYVYPTPGQSSPSSVGNSVPLSSLPTAINTAAASNAYLVYLPINGSARAYLSINKPLYFATALNPALGVMGINDPSVVSLTDPNFYTLYQDFEFGLDDSLIDSTTNLYLNLSFVDYFCLPMQLNTYSYPSNAEITYSQNGLVQVAPAGTLAANTREQIITSVQSQLSAASADWGSLGLAYYANPYTSSTTSNYLRILAAKNSIDLGLSGNPPTQPPFHGALVPQSYFPSTYASSSSSGPVTGQSFMETWYKAYQTGTFYMQIFPQGLSGTTVVYEMTSSGTDQVLNFTSTTGPGPNYTLNLVDLPMDKLLSGATWPFLQGGVAPSTNIYTNELSKCLSGLFTIGQLPYSGTTSSGTPFQNENVGFSALTYFLNPFNYVNGPWLNLYDKVMHLQMIGAGDVPNNPTLGISYAYDYDDLLNMSGLVNGIVIQDAYGNPSTQTAGHAALQPYVMVTLGSLSGTTVPDITQDTYNYQVTVGSAGNGATVVFTYYDSTGTMHSTTASTTTNTILNPLDPGGPGVYVTPTQPFRVTFSFNSSPAYTNTFDINLQRQIVTPIAGNTTFTAADQQYQGNFVFSINGGSSQDSPQFTLTYNSSPPRWPG